MPNQTIWGYPVHESDEIAAPVGGIIRFGDWSQWLVITMAKSEALTDEGIDRLAHDLDVYVSSEHRMYYKGMGVESVFNVLAAEIAPRVLARRHELGMLRDDSTT